MRILQLFLLFMIIYCLCFCTYVLVVQFWSLRKPALMIFPIVGKVVRGKHFYIVVDLVLETAGYRCTEDKWNMAKEGWYAVCKVRTGALLFDHGEIVDVIEDRHSEPWFSLVPRTIAGESNGAKETEE